MDANPEAFLTHLGTAASVGAVLDGEAGRLTAAAPVPLFRSVFGLRCADERSLHARLGDLAGRSGLWWLGPSATPPGADRVLENAGIPRVETMTLMTADLHDLPSSAPDRDIAPVCTSEELHGWAAAHARGHGHPPEHEHAWLSVMTELGTTGPLRHFVARLDGEIVASASTFAGAGTMGLYNVATVPSARGRGIGTAITLGALAAARRDGHRTVMLGAEPPAAALYRRLGFTERAVMKVHQG
jgi:GNAT superfamily N-acetyltransferase